MRDSAIDSPSISGLGRAAPGTTSHRCLISTPDPRVVELTPPAAIWRSGVARDGLVVWNDAAGVIEPAKERQARQLAIA